MPTTRKTGSGLTPAVIQSLRTKGYNYAQIGTFYGITRQAVSAMAKKYGGITPTPREEARRFWPFRVPAHFQRSMINQRLRDHLEYQICNGKGMSERQLYLLRLFYQKIRNENLVVEYDPSIPPSDGVYTGGWAYRPRETMDGKLLIRVNHHTLPMDDEMRRIWQLPRHPPQ